MATHFVVPTYFTANGDDYSATLNKLKKKNKEFAMSAGAVGKQMASYLSVGSLFAGGGLLGKYSFDQAKDYEEAVDAFHTIVSELNDVQFKPFQDKIDQVATSTKRSGTEVANAFEKIAGINAKFAETSEGLGTVTEASITLAKASRMELGTAAENLVGIMNQFSFSADQANRTINALAAGQAVGAANIQQTAEAFTVFGSVAAGANITLEKSVGLVQALGKYSLYGSEAGTKIRGVILRLQKAGLGYANGQFNINNALEQTNVILGKLKNAKERDLFLNRLFGVENITAGRILVKNVKLFEDFTKSVTGTSEAFKAAKINTSNLKTSVAQLASAWSRMITGSKTGRDITTSLTKAFDLLADNVEMLVSVTWEVVKVYGAYKAVMLVSNGIMVASNIYLGIRNVLMLESAALIAGNTVAMKAAVVTEKLFAAAIALSTGNIAAFNVALGLTPFGLVVAGLAAVSAGLYFGRKAYLSYNEAQKKVYANDLAKKDAEYKRAEIASVETLIARYWELGKSMKEAVKTALWLRTLNINERLTAANMKVNEAKRGVGSESVNNPFATFLEFQYGIKSEGKKKAEEKLLQEMQAAKKVAIEMAALKETASKYVGQGIIGKSDFNKFFPSTSTGGGNSINTQTPWGGQQDEVNKRLAFRFYEANNTKNNGTTTTNNSNITVTLINDTDSQVEVSDSDSTFIKKIDRKSTTVINAR